VTAPTRQIAARPIAGADSPSRRAFLRRSAQLAHLAVAGSAAPLALNLAAMGEAAAFNASDYKALVCIFLYGGNDYANTVVSFDPDSHARYASIRAAGAGSAAGSMVISRADLAATLLRPGQPLPQARQYALHPAMTSLASLFNSGRAAVQLNVGPLVVPLTRAQYESSDRRRFPLPPKLFSHNDQQSVWQSSAPEGATTGWGGALADLGLDNNSQALFTCISVTGNGVFLAGERAVSYQCSVDGAVPIKPLRNGFFDSSQQREAYANFLQRPHPHQLGKAYTAVLRRAISAETQVNTALAAVNLGTPFPAGSSLGAQLKMVARLIAARQALGTRRQVFLVSLGGFDLHDELVARQPGLLRQLSEGMSAFYNATVELGVANSVTSFTASDFGRTLSVNGDGSDHGWGAHHLVLGGAVRGARFYGSAPPISVGDSSAPEDQWHVGQGRLLPSTSVDQFAATLGRWFGVPDNQLVSLLPNLANFGAEAGRADYPRNLGFLG